MHIKFEWKYGSDNNKEGVARFKVGSQFHVVPFESYHTAVQVFQLLKHAHAAGAALAGKEDEKERQRVTDWLTIGG
jgi:hypothetical protein